MIHSAFTARAAADRQRQLLDAAAEHRLAKLTRKSNPAGGPSCVQTRRAGWTFSSRLSRAFGALTGRHSGPAPLAGKPAAELVIDLLPVVELPVVTAELAVGASTNALRVVRRHPTADDPMGLGYRSSSVRSRQPERSARSAPTGTQS